MTKGPSQYRPGRGTLLRFGVIFLIIVAYYLGWFWLTGFTSGQEEPGLVDRLLCPLTFVCSDVSSWRVMLVVNGVVFVVWMLFLMGARGFVVGKSFGGKLLGLSVSLLVPLAIIAIFFMGLAISSIH